MYWDGNDYPSVESPIGPFFGQGWDERYNYAALPLSAGPENGTGMSSYFAMPFEKGAIIEIENQTDKTINAFYFYVDYLEIINYRKIWVVSMPGIIIRSPKPCLKVKQNGHLLVRSNPTRKVTEIMLLSIPKGKAILWA